MENKLEKIVNLLEDKLAKDIVVLDIKDQTTLADYFVIVSGGSRTQTKAISNALAEDFKEEVLSVEGRDAGDWIVVDFGDIIVHIFHKEVRDHYELEELWEVI